MPKNRKKKQKKSKTKKETEIIEYHLIKHRYERLLRLKELCEKKEKNGLGYIN